MTAVATIDGWSLPFDPYSVKWGYKLNTVSYDTLGGRVTQLLSVNVTSITLTGVAGSVDRLIKLIDDVGATMSKHVSTEHPVNFSVPVRGWSALVYVSSLPSVGWNLQTVDYPYSLTLDVDEDWSGIASKVISTELDRLSEVIGYNPQWQGGAEQRPGQTAGQDIGQAIGDAAGKKATGGAAPNIGAADPSGNQPKNSPTGDIGGV